MSLTKFYRNWNLPDYLEEALAPFSWAGIFSEDFRRSINLCIMAVEREPVIADFVTTLRLLKFLDREWVETLATALTRFGKEGFEKPQRSS